MSARVVQLLLGILIVLLGVNLTKAFTQDAPAAPPPPPTVASVPPAADEAVMISRTFSVTPGDRLEVSVEHSDVNVRTGSAGEARVEVLLDGRNMEQARAFFEHLRFGVDQEGNTVAISTDRERARNWSGRRSGDAQITVNVWIPERFDADVQIAHGDLDVEAIDGEVEVQIAHGDVSADRLAGDVLRLQVAHGDVDVARIVNRAVDLQIAHGDVSFGEVVAESFSAQLAHGDLDVDALEGQAEVEDAHGDVRIRFTKSNGFSIENAHGDIEIIAPAGMPGDVFFEGSEVNIASSYRFEGTLREERADGRLNGGGPALRAHTTHGSVSLRAY